MAFSIRSLFSKSDSDDDASGASTATLEASPENHEVYGKQPSSTMQHNPFSGASLFKTSNPAETLGQPIGAAFQSPFSPFGAPTAGGLTVGDILSQLPPDVAKAGLHREMPLHMPEDVMEKAMRSPQPALPLFEVYRVCPALFQTPISPNDPRQVLLPPQQTAGRAAPVAAAASPFSVVQAKTPESTNPFAAITGMQAFSPAAPAPQAPGVMTSPFAGMTSPFATTAPAPEAPQAPLNPFLSPQAETNPFAAVTPATPAPVAYPASLPPLPGENPFAAMAQPTAPNPFVTAPTTTVSAGVPTKPESPFGSPFAVPAQASASSATSPQNPFAVPTQGAFAPANPFAQHTPTHPLAPAQLQPVAGAPSLEAALLTGHAPQSFGIPAPVPAAPAPFIPASEAASYPPVQPMPQGMEHSPFMGFEAPAPEAPTPYPSYGGMLAPQSPPEQNSEPALGNLFPPAPPAVAAQSIPLPFQKILSIGKDTALTHTEPAPVPEPNPFAGMTQVEAPVAPALPVFPPATSLLTSEPASTPVVSVPAGENDTIKLSLHSALKKCNQQELGMSPDLIPSWINVSLALAPLRSQVPSGRVEVKLSTIIAGLEESFRSLLINARPETIVELPVDEVFHASASPVALPFEPTPAPAFMAPTSEAYNPFTAAAQSWEQPAMPPAPETPQPFFTEPVAPVAEPPAPSPFLRAAAPVAEAPQPFFGESVGSFLDLSAPAEPEPEPPFAPYTPYVPASQPSPFEAYTKPAETLIKSPFAAVVEEPTFTAPVAAAPAAPVVDREPAPSPDKQTRRLLMRALLGAVAQDDAASIIRATSQQQGITSVVCLMDGREVGFSGPATPDAESFRNRAAKLLSHLQPLIAETGIEGTETFSMRSDNSHVVTFSFQGPTTLCVLHDTSHHDSGLPEKITLIAREVAQMLRETPPSS